MGTDIADEPPRLILPDRCASRLLLAAILEVLAEPALRVFALHHADPA